MGPDITAPADIALGGTDAAAMREPAASSVCCSAAKQLLMTKCRCYIDAQTQLEVGKREVVQHVQSDSTASALGEHMSATRFAERLLQ